MHTRSISISSKWLRSTKSVQKPLDHFEHAQFLPELLLAIAHCIELPRDILKLSLASRRTYELLLPALYASLECKTHHRCKERLMFLSSRPELACYVKKIVLRPNHLMSSSYHCLDGELEISDAFERLLPYLSGLETFFWDGLEPPEESLWIALRTHCTRIRYIGSTVGVTPIPEDSELFNFSDLEGFSLVTNHHERTIFYHPDTTQSFPESVWNLLLDRCGNLKELTLGGKRTSYYTPLFDVRPLVHGRWPELHTLVLGHTFIRFGGFTLLDWDSVSRMEIIKDYNCFISSHPHLRNLHIPSGANFPLLDLTGSKVVIKEFCGSHLELGGILPYSHLTILKLCSQTLQLWCLVDLLPRLRSLHSLSTLELWIDLSIRVKADLDGVSPEKIAIVRETDHIRVFQSLVKACPALLHLKIICSTKRKYGFLMKDVWRAFESLSRLQSLEIQKVYSIVEENMARSALRIARHIPSLQQITLFYAKEPWWSPTRAKVKQTGIYDITAAGNSEFIRIVANENGEGLLRPFSRRATEPNRANYTPCAIVDVSNSAVDHFKLSTSKSPIPRTAFSSVSITFLGTASAQPSSTRNHSSLALHLGRDVWIFDCGEATQHQIQKSTVKMGRIEKIFITHTHGDHIFGLIPLMASCMNGAGGTADGIDDPRAQVNMDQPSLEIYGPLGTRAYVRNGLAYSHTLLSSPYVVHELRTPSDPQAGDFTSLTRLPFELPHGRNIPQVDGVWSNVFKDDIVSVSAGPIHHSVPCVGFVVTEAPVPGKIDPKKYIPDLKRTNTPMSVMRQLQQGERVELSDGTVIHGPPRRKGRKLVILGDTFDPSPIIPLAMDADLLVHEATNAHLPGIDTTTKDSDTYETVETRAKSRGHSTPQMAGAFARRIQARRLVLNHFSPRYSGGDAEDAIKVMGAIADLAAKEFGHEVQCARDLMSIEVGFIDHH